MTRVRRHRGRPGFTLVELLVVTALVILVAGLTVAIFQTGFLASQQVHSGNDRVQGWLLIAKQRAKRDHAPRGVRFILSPQTGISTVPNSFEVKEALYIEAPDAWAPNNSGPGNPSGARMVFVYQQNAAGRIVPPPNPNLPPTAAYTQPTPPQVYFVSTNPTDLIEFDQRVSQDDYLVLPEFGTSYRILWTTLPPGPPISVPSNQPAPASPVLILNPTNSRLIGLANYPDLGTSASNSPSAVPPPPPIPANHVTYQFGFQAAPRPLLGEPTLLLPDGIVIDYRAPVQAPPYPLGGLAFNGAAGNLGYRDWNTLTSPVSAPPNPAPYWPTTTIGIQTVPPPVLPPATAPTPQFFDIMFAPSGQVMYNPNATIVLWIRSAAKTDHPRLADPTAAAPSQLDLRSTYDDAGEQKLLTIYVRTGLIATHEIYAPPSTPTAGYDPYKFTKDGQNSGL